MQDLHLVGFTKDHRHLIFSTRKDAKSGDYVVPVDDDLVEAVDEVVSHRADGPDAAADQVEAPPSPPRVESQLSVREVQARLRAGDPAPKIARDAGVDAEWVERFAQPIRAEQRRVVDRALAVPLTRARAGESAVPLRRAIAAAMAERDVDFSAEGFEAAWSARLVGGNEWIVAFEFPNRGRHRVLEWEFDIGSGTLTTTDRYASQLAFVEAVTDLPPVEATVGAEPTRVGSQLSRGPLTSGGLARPGSGRVTEPSASATSLPPVVRPTPTRPTPPSAPPRPTPPARPSPTAQTSPPRPWPPAQASPDRSAERRPATAPPTPSPAMVEPDSARRIESVELPQRPARPEPPRPAVPPVDRPRQPMTTEGGRSPATPVPPRRPAPVAPLTNATRSHTRRPVPEVAPRMPVVVDPDAADAAARRRSLVEDEHALDDAVPSHPPGGRGESVVILRAVDEPAEADEPDEPAADLVDDWDGDDDVDDAGEEEGEWEDADDEWVETEADHSDDAAAEWLDDDEWVDDEAEDLEDADLDEADDVEAELVDGGGHDDEHADDFDREFDDEFEDAADAEVTDDDAAEPDEPAADLVDDWDGDDVESDVDAESKPRPVKATVRRRPSTTTRPRGRRRLVARPEPGERADQPEVVESTSRRESSVQFRPGSATQAGSGRPDANPNGRDDADDAEEQDESNAQPGDAGPRSRRRRRRTEPLRAR